MNLKQSLENKTVGQVKNVPKNISKNVELFAIRHFKVLIYYYTTLCDKKVGTFLTCPNCLSYFLTAKKQVRYCYFFLFSIKYKKELLKIKRYRMVFMKNYYETLELNKKASKEVIEKAYKTLVKKYHPDIYTGSKKEYAEKKLKELNEAYEVLSDEFLKEQYDAQIQKEENEKKKKEIQQKEIEKFDAKMKKHKVGTFLGLIELTKEILKNKHKRDEIKEITKKDIIAVIATIIIIILVGIVLWNIPFTNGWMRELLFENPIFNVIGGLFTSK